MHNKDQNVCIHQLLILMFLSNEKKKNQKTKIKFK